MKTFMLDLWHDLRAKRLWPVAILLAVALAAVPLVLRKPADEPPAPAISTAPQAKAANAEAEELAVKALQEGSVPSSTLDTFSAKNPFKPLVKERSVEDLADQLGAGDAPSGGSAPTDGGASTGGDSSGGGDSGGGDPRPVDPGDENENDDDGGKPTTTNYTYVVDVTFTANDRRRRIAGMQRLDILPGEANPLLLLLGVDDGGGNAVFLVDSTLTAAGEGACKPNAQECAFVHIGPGSEHQFTNEDGDSYTLRIDEIRKVKVPTQPKRARSSKRPRASAAVGKSAPARRFVPRVLSDLVVVATDEAADSNTDTDRR